VKANGPIYVKIAQGKDLIADILPPPEYIIESYLNCLQMVEAVGTDKNGLPNNSMHRTSAGFRPHFHRLRSVPQRRIRYLVAYSRQVPLLPITQSVENSLLTEKALD
jgi:hypothetical protein